MFHSNSRNTLKQTSHPSKSNSMLTNHKYTDTGLTEMTDYKRSSSFTSQFSLHSHKPTTSQIKTLPNQSELRIDRVSKLLFNRQKQNEINGIKRCPSQKLETLLSVNSSKDFHSNRSNSEVEFLRAENRKLKSQIGELIVKQSKMQQLQKDYQKLGAQFQKILTGKKSFEQMLIKQIDFSKQLQKRIDIQSAQNDTLKQQIRLLQNVITDLRKQNSSLVTRIDDTIKRGDQANLDERISTLQGYVLELQGKIKEDMLEWDVQKEVWKREVQMYEEVIQNLEHKLIYK